MAEGDSIWRLARRLDGALAGHTVTRGELRVPRWATADLAGRDVLGVAPRGKHLLMRFSGDLTLHTHLRMQGSWRLQAKPPPPDRHDRVRVLLVTTGPVAVGERLPVVELVRTSREGRAVGHLGPDLLGPDWDLDEAVHRLRADPGRPLVEALLDQRCLAGIGNLYAVEGCFLARRDPWTPWARSASCLRP